MKREDLETLSTIRLMTGIQLRLTEHESLHKLNISDTCIMVSVTVHDIVETARETRFRRQGWKMHILERTVAQRSDGQDRWRLEVLDVMWDDTFTPYVFRHFDRYETLAEQTDRAEWEKMCHRPGTRSTPMDNLDRKFQGYDYKSGSTFYQTESEN